MTTTLVRLLLAAALGLLPLAANSAGLTPASFVEADIAAREATLAGLQQRLTILKGGGTAQDEMAAAEASRTAVDAVFTRCGTNGAAHAAYAAAHGEEIQRWLDANPDWITRYADLEVHMQELSAAFESARGR